MHAFTIFIVRLTSGMIIPAFIWRCSVKKVVILTVALVLASFGLGYGFAASKTYQVTGPVVEVRPDAIVVKKGTENWELAKDAGTKSTGGDAKVGDKVTVTYRMTATSIELKPAAAPAKKK
jgi:hypothetical protein